MYNLYEIPDRRNLYEPLNITSSRIVRVAAASGLAQEFQIVLQAKVKIKNITSSVYSRLYGRFHMFRFSCSLSTFFSSHLFCCTFFLDSANPTSEIELSHYIRHFAGTVQEKGYTLSMLLHLCFPDKFCKSWQTDI